MSSESKYRVRFVPMVKSIIKTKLYEMDEFIDFLFEAIKKEKESTKIRMDDDTKNMSEEEKEEYYDWFAEDYQKIEDVFAQTSISSFIVILYSYIESGLNSLCTAEMHDRKINIEYSDMKGKGIDRAKLYYEKVLGLTFPSQDIPWSEIRALNKIRNAIVHEDGWVNADIIRDSCIKKHIDQKCITIQIRQSMDKDGSIINIPGKFTVHREYLNYINEQVKKFFDSL